MANINEETPILIESEETVLAERDDLVNGLIDKLLSDRFVAVNGPVGSGKSTLVHTLLVRELKNFEGRAGKDWRVVYTKPGVNPLGNLAEALAKPIVEASAGSFPFGLFNQGSASINTVSTNIFTQVTAKKNSEGIFTPVESSALTTIYEAALLDQKKTFNLLIIVDQAHDLFRYQLLWDTMNQKGAGAGDDAIYFNLLLNAKRSTVPIYVIMVADSRHSNHFYKYKGLPEAINNSGYYVPAIFEAKDLKNFLYSKIVNKNPSNKEKIKEFEPLVDQLIIDYQKLYKVDPAVIMNLNMVVDLLAQEPGPDYLQVYKSRIQAEGFAKDDPPLKKVIAYNLERNVFPKLKTQNGPDEETLKRIFQALTNLEGNSTYYRRPVRMKNLLEIANRPALTPEDSMTENKPHVALTKEAIDATLRAFNTLEEHFVFLPDKVLSDETIVDINSEALLNSWPKLRSWIHEEWVHSQVYQNLVRDAIPYFISQIPVEQPENTNAQDGFNQPGVYNGAAFLSAKNWIEKCRPNSHWALRYLPIPPEEFEQLKKRILGIKKDGSANFTIAKKFYEESVKVFDDAIDQKKGELQRAKRQRTRAWIIAGFATIIMGLAIIFWIQVKLEKQKIHMYYFVNTLAYNWALAVPNDMYSETDTVAGIIAKIDKSRKLRTEDALLNYLLQEKIINIGTQNDTIKDLSFAALKTLQNNDSTNAYSTLKDYYTQLIKLGEFNKRKFSQYPAFYYAMYGQYWGLMNKDNQDDRVRTTIIESGAITAINRKVSYGFGDKNGKIHLRSRGNLTLDSPNVGGVIKSLCFSQDNGLLFLGTELGEVSTYDIQYLNNGQTQKKQNSWRTPVFADELKKSIYFLGVWPGNPDLLLVASTFQTYFLKRSSPTKYGVFGKKILLAPKGRIGCRIWNPEHQLLLVGGRDSVVVYHLDPRNSQSPIQPLAYIRSDFPTTITSLAIRFKQVGAASQGTIFELAMGDEVGNLWIDEVELPKNQTSTLTLSLNDFEKFKGAESTITCMVFNPKRPQLAVGSMDGTLRLWNLSTLKKNDYDTSYDDITLRYNNVVNAITFLNEDELAIHCGIFSFVEPTNINYMAKILKFIPPKK